MPEVKGAVNHRYDKSTGETLLVYGSRNSSGGISGGGDVVIMGTVIQGEIASCQSHPTVTTTHKHQQAQTPR